MAAASSAAQPLSAHQRLLNIESRLLADPFEKECNLYFYKMIKGQFHILFGCLQNQENPLLNGTYAIFSEKTKPEDLNEAGYVLSNAAQRKVTQLFRGKLTPSDFFEVLAQDTTELVVTQVNRYFQSHFFIEVNSHIEKAIKGFQPNREFSRVRWIQPQSVIHSVSEKDRLYLQMRVSCIIDNEDRVPEWNRERAAQGAPPLTKQEIENQMDSLIQNDPRIESIRNTHLIFGMGKDKDGGNTPYQIAPAAGRVLHQLQITIKKITRAKLECYLKNVTSDSHQY